MKPIWTEYKKSRVYPGLTQDLTADVAIVGGGIAGILLAYLLSKEGKSVVLVEAEEIGSGATAYTTAHLTEEIDTSISDLAKMFGPEKAKLVRKSHAAAIDLIENIVKTEKIDCEFIRCPAYVYATTEKQFAAISEDAKTARHFDFEAAACEDENLNLDNFGYVKIPDQAKFHPLKFLYALAEIAAKAGVQIFEKTEAREIIPEQNHVTVLAAKGKIQATHAIVATYNPFNQPASTYFKKGMYKSYVLSLKIPKHALAEALYWDASNPYYYFRIDPQKNYDRMILGGADHRREFPIDEEKNFDALKNHLQDILPDVMYQVETKWTGSILEPADGLALIGEYKPRQLMAAAFSGNGMTYAAIAGMILRDKILGRENPWAEIYNPKRPLTAYRLWKKGRDYTEEMLGGAVKNILKIR